MAQTLIQGMLGEAASRQAPWIDTHLAAQDIHVEMEGSRMPELRARPGRAMQQEAPEQQMQGAVSLLGLAQILPPRPTPCPRVRAGAKR